MRYSYGEYTDLLQVLYQSVYVAWQRAGRCFMNRKIRQIDALLRKDSDLLMRF